MCSWLEAYVVDVCVLILHGFTIRIFMLARLLGYFATASFDTSMKMTRFVRVGREKRRWLATRRGNPLNETVSMSAVHGRVPHNVAVTRDYVYKDAWLRIGSHEVLDRRSVRRTGGMAHPSKKAPVCATVRGATEQSTRPIMHAVQSACLTTPLGRPRRRE